MSTFFSIFDITDSHRDFGYSGINGPSYWGKDFTTCVGKHQSPINIEEHQVRNITLPPLIFSGLHNPRMAEITNNGHTVMVVMDENIPARVFGGPLNDTYIFEQMHFHWGEKDTEGSEDLINNHSFAMELHAVFFKEQYKSMTEAVHHSDGVTVLAYFFEVDKKPNLIYDEIISILPDVESLDSKSQFTSPLQLSEFLQPKTVNLENYFTYTGSLTTPPCAEVVTWIDFKEPLQLSHNQIEHFRRVRNTAGQKLTHNFRPVQPLEDRIVCHNIPLDDMNFDDNFKSENYVHSGEYSINVNKVIIFLSIIINLKLKFS
ncbi:carbonic anhydrase 2 isoform X2 [Leptopilina boulardi]|uniref:carbonic anhydrase 2 isoform X2 n=1 Tax=Leptopilina boulardi TaxID=63433 RepID=UPI0021F5B55F|nr:carbonic anhydrase 2 isoform X2 [Leptopilina boulardi]